MNKPTATRLFPILHSIDDFVSNNHPVLHPDSRAYEKYWEEQEKYCVEGKWGEDKNKETDEGGWRYMPANLYFYINMWKILHLDKKNKSRKIISPYLRDVEWLLSYGWLTARGFSGFEDDDEVTCNRLVVNYDPEGPIILPKECYNSEGELKRYVEARKYLYQTHEKPLGRALYQNDAKNFFVLGARGFGKSFYCSGAVMAHEFLFDGHKRFDEEYLFDPNNVEIFLGSALSDKSSQMVSMFRMGMRELPGNYGEGDDYMPSPLYKNCSGVLTPNNKQNPYRHYYKERQGGDWVDRGSLSALYHGIYTTENPQAAVGGRYTVMVIEEVGLLPNVLSVHGANETCQTEGTDKFGSSFYIGTGGNMEKIIESKLIFNDPESYGFLGYSDVFENRSKPIGFFMPAYYALNQYKDDKGNTDVEKAFEYLEQTRDKKRAASTSTAINEEMMARPIVPSEMFLSKEGTVFPVDLLRERLAKVESEDLWKARASVGTLEYDKNGAVYWEEDITRRHSFPITRLNLDDLQGDIGGSVVIYEHPPANVPGPTYNKSLYKVVYDPVKDDNGGTSLAAIIVHKGFADTAWEDGLQDAIVAEYIGRLDKVNDIHEIAIKLAHYFNAKVLVENNIPDFIRYCQMQQKWHLLQTSPYLAMSKALKNVGRKYEVGVTMSNRLNTHCEQLLRQWLLEEWSTSDGVKTNVDKLYSTRIMEEMLNYNREMNFDAISALKLLALWLSQETEVPIKENEYKDRHKELQNYLSSLRGNRRKNALRKVYYEF